MELAGAEQIRRKRIIDASLAELLTSSHQFVVVPLSMPVTPVCSRGLVADLSSHPVVETRTSAWLGTQDNYENWSRILDRKQVAAIIMQQSVRFGR
mmetsp:Transcript_10344/g.17147  ORF Transcript_10344/g.17147 Transcript_10344/m.17147 type:complete len:96 (-) Transcript_10344:715-1002(-)